MVYGYGRKSKYRKWTLPLELELFGTPCNPESKAQASGKPVKDPARAGWSVDVPILVRGMFVTDNVLVIAGPRDLYDEEKIFPEGLTENDKIFSLQQEHMEGKHGSVLKVINKATGKELSSMELEDMPTWDGMITSGGRIFMSTTSGKVLCFKLK